MTDDANDENVSEVSDDGFPATRRVRLNRGQGPSGRELVMSAGSDGEKGGVRMFLFMGGCVFAVGMFIVLISLDVIPTDPSKFHAPRWVVAMAGGIFAVVGFYLMVLGVLAWKVGAALARNKLRFPNEPALADYLWDRERYREKKFGSVMGAFGAAMGLGGFTAPFYWWAFLSGDGPWPVKIGIGFMCLMVLFMALRAFYKLVQWIKYGATEIRFTAFPYRPGEVIELLWSGGRVVTSYEKLTFTLRCIERQTVPQTRGSKRQRSTRSTRMTQVWADRYIVEGPGRNAYGEEIPVTFLLPLEAVSTKMRAVKAFFWELEIMAKTRGVDFKARYLVPIYGEEERTDA